MLRKLMSLMRRFIPRRSLNCNGTHRKHCDHYIALTEMPNPASSCTRHVKMIVYQCCRCPHTYTKPY